MNEDVVEYPTWSSNVQLQVESNDFKRLKPREKRFLSHSVPDSRQNVHFQNHCYNPYMVVPLSYPLSPINFDFLRLQLMQNTLKLNNTLFVGNLHTSMQEIDLIQVFRPFGRIVECCKKWLHFGFVKFSTEEEACHAYVMLNGFRLKGRPMRLEFQNRTKKPHIKEILAQANDTHEVLLWDQVTSPSTTIAQSPLNCLLRKYMDDDMKLDQFLDPDIFVKSQNSLGQKIEQIITNKRLITKSKADSYTILDELTENFDNPNISSIPPSFLPKINKAFCSNDHNNDDDNDTIDDASVIPTDIDGNPQECDDEEACSDDGDSDDICLNFDANFKEICRTSCEEADASQNKMMNEFGIYGTVNDTKTLFIEPEDLLKPLNYQEDNFQQYRLFPLNNKSFI